ncbi:MAG TPA: hypothetical protein VFW85_03845 [Gaiellaceae bacterium]|nr:hypothetical protein [Gaiellaceae bacterium]
MNVGLAGGANRVGGQTVEQLLAQLDTETVREAQTVAEFYDLVEQTYVASVQAGSSTRLTASTNKY